MNDILKSLKEKRTLIDTLKKRKWLIIGHILSNNDKTEVMSERTRVKGRHRIKYITKETGVIFQRELKDIANNRETGKEYFL